MERNNKTNIMITAIIPVRKGSQRVKNKNIKPFGGSSLLEIKMRLIRPYQVSVKKNLILLIYLVKW